MRLSSDSNIFRLTTPQDYMCSISVYSGGRSDMYIKVWHMQRADEHFHLVFRRVVYFSGMMTWRSADFQHASSDEYLDFVQNMDAAPVSKGDEQYQLYIVDYHYPPTYIIALAAEKLDKVSPIVTAAEQ